MMNLSKKRTLALVLCLATLLGTLSACSTASQEVEATASTQSEVVAQPQVTEEVDVAVEADTTEVVEDTAQAVVPPEVEAEPEPEPEVEVAPEVEAEVEIPVEVETVTETVEMLASELSVPLTGSPAISTVLMPVASGVTVYANTKASIDASNTADGYVMIRLVASATDAHKVIVTGPSGTPYYYNLTTDGSYEVFPLSDGSGSYQIQVCQNVSGTSYAVAHSASISVALTDEFAPFLLPNQYVNYASTGNVVATAATLVAGKTTELEKIQSVYSYVVGNLTYDQNRAATVTSGYLPDLESVLAEKKGICFDYAALMTAMLRSQGIPCKLVVGYAGTSYHAWINTYSETEGWMDSVIYFDGTTWKLMDPTFASSAGSSDSIMQYIGDGANYTAKYLY